MKKTLVLASFLFIHSSVSFAQEFVDLDIVNRIRDEGLSRSKAMETIAHLTDVIGSRLTGSPAFKQANQWARDKLIEYGLENAHLESWEFGRGWSFSHVSIHMASPRITPLIALPKAWTPGTEGTVTGAAMRVKIESVDDLNKLKGRVAGKILFLDDIREVEETSSLPFRRYSEDDLEELTKSVISRRRAPREDYRQRYMEQRKLVAAYHDFLVDEKVVATVEISSRDNGLVRVTGGGSREVSKNPGVTELVMIAEHYNWIIRLLETHKQEVRLELNVAAKFHDDDTNGYNTIADFPGADKANEIVLLGGHLDSWHAGTGATDDAAGCVVAMEAMRILKAIDAKPRRTIRIGLWGGEEQGFLGSNAYVKEYLAARPEPMALEPNEQPSGMRRDQGPLKLKADHAKFSAYFNLDNGGGKIRGIYAQGNAAVKPIFESWLRPFEDLGATTVAMRNTGGTDHLPFNRVGLPGFQFIQDGLDYSSRTHHTNVDVYDHLRESDLIQASIIMAAFVYHAAMRDEIMPRKPMQKPERGRNRRR